MAVKGLFPVRMRTVLFLAIAVVLLPALAALTAHNLLLFRQARAREEQANLEVARSIAATFHVYISKIARQSHSIGLALARLPEFDQQSAGDYLAEAERTTPDVEAFYWVNPQGAVLASSLPRGQGVGADLSFRPYFQEIAQGRQTVLTDLFGGSITGQRIFVVAEGIRSTDGHLDGVMVATVNRTRLITLLAETHRLSDARVTLFDRQGELVVMHPPGLIASDNWLARDANLRRALGGEEVSGIYNSPVDGSRRIGVRVPVPECGWVVGTGRPYGVVQRLYLRTMVAGLTWAASLAAFAFLLAALLNRWVARGVGDLQAHTAAVTEGNLSHRVSHHAIREVDRLGRDLNTMTSSLQEALAHLEEREAFLRKVMNSSLNGLYIYDLAEGAHAFINTQYTALTGYGLDEIRSKRGAEFEALFHPDDLPAIRGHLRAIAQAGEGEVLEIEYRFLRNDGEWRWFFSRATAFLRNADGSVRQFIGTFLDVTDRKKAEEAVRESEARFRAMFEGHGAIMLLIEPQTGAIADANRAAEAFYGYSRERLQSMRIDQINQLPPDAVAAERQRAVAAGKERFTFPHRLANGQVRWVEVYSSSVTIQGRPMLFSVIHDITQRRRAEEALRESEERFRILADNMSQFAWMADGQGQIFWYNKRWYDYTGTSPEDAQGSNWQTFVHPDHVERIMEKIRRCIEMGEVWEDTFPVRDSDGNYRWFLSLAVPLRNDEDRVWRWLGTNTDVTEQIEAEQRLKAAAEELHRSNQDLEQFAYIASHDLRAPLRVVGGYARILQEDFAQALGPEGRGHLATIEDSIQRMDRLMSDLLAFSRVGTRGRQAEPVEMSRVLEEALQSSAVAVRESGAAITHDPLPTVWGDATQLNQLLANLIGNALKFRRKDALPRVHVEAMREAGFWRFCVRDNGIGIEPAHYDRIFQVFQRLHGEGDYPGTGIGLAICKKIVERHGGRIWVESVPGEGSAFFFTIPDRENQPV